jgi:hypothetical protein
MLSASVTASLQACAIAWSWAARRGNLASPDVPPVGSPGALLVLSRCHYGPEYGPGSPSPAGARCPPMREAGHRVHKAHGSGFPKVHSHDRKGLLLYTKLARVGFPKPTRWSFPRTDAPCTKPQGHKHRAPCTEPPGREAPMRRVPSPSGPQARHSLTAGVAGERYRPKEHNCSGGPHQRPRYKEARWVAQGCGRRVPEGKRPHGV